MVPASGTQYAGFETNGMRKPKTKMLLIAAHIVSWLVFLSLPAIFNPRRQGAGIYMFINDLLEPPRWANALLLIAVFYFNYYVALPLLFFTRKYAALVLSFVASCGVFFLLNYELTPPGLTQQTSGFNFPGNSFNLFMFIIVYSLSYAIWLYEQWQSTREQMLNTEIMFLKSQINPHFLFNTLNNIYSLALIKSDEAPEAIVKLSEMMRYSVDESNKPVIDLSKEIGYICNYIKLQKLRLTGNVKVSFEIAGETDSKKVAPFLLIPFIENAFKHGVNAEDDSDIRIRIAVQGKELSLSVVNNKVFMRNDLARGHHLGINTTTRRLRRLYSGRHVLEIRDTEKEFNVLLKIDLK